MESLLETQRDIYQEMIRRNNARNGLIEYIRYVKPNAMFPPFQQEIAYNLERVERGEVRILLINLPRKYGKSFVASHNFPAWYIGRNPEREILHGAYGTDLVADFGRKIRNILASDRNRLLFDVGLMKDSSSKVSFHTTNGCTYFAAGMDGGFTGKGMHLGIIEDPLKIKDSESKTEKDNCWDFFTDTFFTCGLKDFAIVVVMQRLAEDDLTGRILEEHRNGVFKGMNLVHLKMPAISKDGIALWPEYKSVDDLLALRRVVGPRVFNAQFLQEPDPILGTIAQRAWFKFWKTLPAFDEVIFSCDLAFKKTSESSFVCMHVWGRHGHNYYLIDRVHERMNYPETKKAFRNLYESHQEAYTKLIEDKANGPALEAELRETIPGITLVPKDSDKVSCLHAATPPLFDGRVYVPDPTVYPWAEEVIQEISKFPNAPNDDDADCFSQAMKYFQQNDPEWVSAMTEDGGTSGMLELINNQLK